MPVLLKAPWLAIKTTLTTNAQSYIVSHSHNKASLIAGFSLLTPHYKLKLVIDRKEKRSKELEEKDQEMAENIKALH